MNIMVTWVPWFTLSEKNTVCQRFRDKLATSTCCYIGGTCPYIPARLLTCWKHIQQGNAKLMLMITTYYNAAEEFTQLWLWSLFHFIHCYSISFLDTWWSCLIPVHVHIDSLHRFPFHSPRVQASGRHYPNATRVCIPLAPAFPCQDLRLVQDGWTNGASRFSRQGMSLEIWSICHLILTSCTSWSTD